MHLWFQFLYILCYLKVKRPTVSITHRFLLIQCSLSGSVLPTCLPFLCMRCHCGVIIQNFDAQDSGIFTTNVELTHYPFLVPGTKLSPSVVSAVLACERIFCKHRARYNRGAVIGIQGCSTAPASLLPHLLLMCKKSLLSWKCTVECLALFNCVHAYMSLCFTPMALPASPWMVSPLSHTRT